jgi:hypothetical protein
MMETKIRHPEAPRDARRIIEIAMTRLGLSPDYFGPLPSNEDFPVSTWVQICRDLHLSLDCISYGYFYSEHRYRLRKAWRDGAIGLPQTPELLRILEEAEAEIRSDSAVFPMTISLEQPLPRSLPASRQ